MNQGMIFYLVFAMALLICSEHSDAIAHKDLCKYDKTEFCK